MRRLLPIVLLIATTAAAQIRSRAITPPKPDLSGNTVAGTVSSVSGSLILLANGLIAIDTTGAKMGGDDPAPGALVIAVLKSGDVAANAPLPALYVVVTRIPQTSLTGTVTAVDPINKTLTLLGRTIHVTPQTVFSSAFPTFKAVDFSDIVRGQLLQVDVNPSGNTLVATSVRILAFSTPPLPSVIHGIVKSIGSDEWVITAKDKDVTVKVNKQTKIAGDPKVGDMVDVIVDSDNVAIAIVRSPTKP